MCAKYFSSSKHFCFLCQVIINAEACMKKFFYILNTSSMWISYMTLEFEPGWKFLSIFTKSWKVGYSKIIFKFNTCSSKIWTQWIFEVNIVKLWRNLHSLIISRKQVTVTQQSLNISLVRDQSLLDTDQLYVSSTSLLDF